MGLQGYQILASGDGRYLDLARDCARSLHYWDSRRPVQLVTDLEHRLTKSDAPLFDVVTPFSPREGYTGPLTKLQMLEHAAFESTMFVDADCLLLKSDIDHWWEQGQGGPGVAIAGTKRGRGEWYGMSIEAMCELASVESLVQMNSGAVYFRKNSIAEMFFDTAHSLFADLGNFTQHTHRASGPPDEPFLAIAMARCGIEPVSVFDAAGSAWMLSTVRSFEHKLDAFDGNPRLTKDRELSPTICHFVGLQPTELYRKLVAQFQSLTAA